MLVVLSKHPGRRVFKVGVGKRNQLYAFYDAADGAAQPFLFNRQAEQAIIEAEAAKTKLGALFIDLDSFKSVNDTTGHEGGDMLHRQVGLGLSERLGTEAPCRASAATSLSL
jgi:diguanylate cyclase (GGDEF)-like protein